MIYFAEAVGIGNIKIGFTSETDPGKRMAGLLTGCPVPLRILATIPGTRLEEKDLHRRFAASQVAGAGDEWFLPVPELLALIGKPAEQLQVGPVEVKPFQVEIRCLTVNRRQMTKAFLFQLETAPLLDWDMVADSILQGDPEDCFLSSPADFLLGRPWGWITVKDPRFQREDGSGRLSHGTTAKLLLWEKEGSLFWEWVSWKFCPAYVSNPLEVLKQHERWSNNLPQESWDVYRTYVDSLDQLFLGV